MFYFRFVVDLIESFGGRWTSSSASDTENKKAKKSVIKFFFCGSEKKFGEMEEFEFELLKTELLTQPLEKDGNQLFHRNTSWIKKVSLLISCNSTFFHALHLVDLPDAFSGF